MAHLRLRKHLRFIFLTLVILLIIPFTLRDDQERVYAPVKLDDIDCVLAFKEQDDTSKVLIAGMCYELLRNYSLQKGINVKVSLERRGESSIDSLQAGKIDLVAIPKYEVPSLEDMEVTSPVMDLFVFACPEKNRSVVTDIDAWLSEYVLSSEYKSLTNRFGSNASPFKKASSENPGKTAGPYDDLIKKAASSIDWDWRMMAALIWQESKFRIDVESRRGARGLMQMMPHTAAKLGCKNIIDPQECISTGTLYIARLQRLFGKYAANQLELEKMTLAAYNAGEGRIQDCINFAFTKGIQVKTWDDIAKVIPMMSEDEILDLDTVKLGKFKGIETIAYVDAVKDIYEAYCSFCPESN